MMIMVRWNVYTIIHLEWTIAFQSEFLWIIDTAYGIATEGRQDDLRILIQSERPSKTYQIHSFKSIIEENAR